MVVNFSALERYIYIYIMTFINLFTLKIITNLNYKARLKKLIIYIKNKLVSKAEKP